MTRAARYDTLGGPEVLYVEDIVLPDPDHDLVLVGVSAAGLNPFDAKQSRGWIPSSAPFPRGI